jgi:hypothetical protein
VARALTLLRLTRWLSLVRRRRDPRTGRIQGNLYVLHDEPLTPFEAMQLDPDYLDLVSQALTHASKAVQHVGVHTLQEVAEDPLLNGRALPTRLQVLAHRLASQGWNALESYPQDETIHETEEGPEALLRHGEQQSSESEAGRKAPSDGILRNPKQDRTVRKESIKNNKIRTVPRARENLRLPHRFLALKEEQQSGALVALQRVDDTLQQAVLDESRRLSLRGHPESDQGRVPCLGRSAGACTGRYFTVVSGIAARARARLVSASDRSRSRTAASDPPARSVQGVLKPAGYTSGIAQQPAFPPLQTGGGEMRLVVR